MNVNGHADEHGRQQREDVRLNQDHEDLTVEIPTANGIDTTRPTLMPIAWENISVNKNTNERIERIAIHRRHIGGKTHGRVKGFTNIRTISI